MSNLFLLDVFREFKNCDSIIWKGEEYDYRSLINKIEECYGILEEHEVEQGSVVALCGDFSPNAIALLLALIRKACIIVPLSSLFTTNEDLLFQIAGIECVFRVNDDDAITMENISPRRDNAYYSVIREREHPGLVLFTSGTSGQPKAAVHDFMALLEKFRIRRKALRTLNFLLFDHWGGLNTMFHILSNGGVVIATSDRHPENVCRLIERHKIELLPTLCWSVGHTRNMI